MSKVKASHILVKKRSEAIRILDEIKAGTLFRKSRFKNVTFEETTITKASFLRSSFEDSFFISSKLKPRKLYNSYTDRFPCIDITTGI